MYKNLLFRAMYPRLERAPQFRSNRSSPQWKPSATWSFLSLKLQISACSAEKSRTEQTSPILWKPFIESNTRNLNKSWSSTQKTNVPICLEISGVVPPPLNLIVESVFGVCLRCLKTHLVIFLHFHHLPRTRLSPLYGRSLVLLEPHYMDGHKYLQSSAVW